MCFSGNKGLSTVLRLCQCSQFTLLSHSDTITVAYFKAGTVRIVSLLLCKNPPNVSILDLCCDQDPKPLQMQLELQCLSLSKFSSSVPKPCDLPTCIAVLIIDAVWTGKLFQKMGIMGRLR